MVLTPQVMSLIYWQIEWNQKIRSAAQTTIVFLRPNLRHICSEIWFAKRRFLHRRHATVTSELCSRYWIEILGATTAKKFQILSIQTSDMTVVIRWLVFFWYFTRRRNFLEWIEFFLAIQKSIFKYSIRKLFFFFGECTERVHVPAFRILHTA